MVSSLKYCRQYTIQGAVCQRPYFVIRAVLDGMPDKNRFRIATQGAGLGPGGFCELAGGNENSRYSAAFQVCDVMHTARRTGTSIRQRFYDGIAIGADFLVEFNRRHPGKSRLFIAFDVQPLLSETGFDMIQKDIPAGFRNIEQPYRLCVERRQPRGFFAQRR